MRIDPSDGIDHVIEVFLNGVSQVNVVAADDAQHWVDRYITRAGEIQRDKTSGLPLIERVFGHVRITMHRKPKWEG